MVGNTQNPIKVYFIKGGRGNPNSASYNRFQALIKMVAINFPYELSSLPDNSGKRWTNKYKYLNAIKFRLQIISSLFKIPASTLQHQNVVFALSTDPLIYLISKAICYLKKNKFIVERNEFPEIIRNNIKWKTILYKSLFLWWQYKLPDGMFIMTDNLIRFYSKYTRKDCFIQKLPMTVDFKRFNAQKEQEIKPYIAYTGSLYNKKDGILFLINAFEKLTYSFPELELKIAGGSPTQVKEIQQLVNKKGISKKVELLGSLERKRIPALLINAKILVLPRPDSIQARGGFPTKLGEYLASGKPIVVTRVGEIDGYLSDEDVFFISPKNIEMELIEQVKSIIYDDKTAQTIAANGQKIAYQSFSIDSNSIKVKKLIMNVVNKK